ncbi:MAG: DUF1501 domain-containing protein [Planctomycetaceae bacterium]|jgi:hypothetical protein
MISFENISAPATQGIARREWLRVGGLSSVGLTLPVLLRAERSKSGSGGSFGRARSCILCFMFGGPAHQDIWDLKPEAPLEVRGPFNPISTNVPGTHFGEHIPKTARMADRFALIRSVTHPDSTHTVAMHYMQTGVRHRRPDTNPTNLADDFPCFGATMNSLNRNASLLPAGISLNAPGNEIPSGHVFPGFFAGFIGPHHDPMFVTDDPSGPDFNPLPIGSGLARPRIDARVSLLRRLDFVRGQLDQVEAIHDTAGLQDKALGLMNSPKAARAFTLSSEKQTTRARYGSTPFGQGCLLARRLVQAGVRLVTVNWSRDYQARVADHWDTHADNFVKHQNLLAAFDLGYTALLEDLEQRGLLDGTLVAVIGEFGRTPKINGNAGRDHWPGCFSITLAGAGVRGGLVHGASDRIAAYPARDPVSPEEVAATIYHALGVPADTVLTDHSGRPYPLTTGQPLLELFG